MNGKNPVAALPPYDPWWYSFWEPLWGQGNEDAYKDDPDLPAAVGITNHCTSLVPGVALSSPLKEVSVCHRRTL